MVIHGETQVAAPLDLQNSQDHQSKVNIRLRNRQKPPKVYFTVQQCTFDFKNTDFSG